jgi:hypothetical protein
MKLIECNSKHLTVRDVGPPLMKLSAATIPLKYNGKRVVDDDLARRIIRDLLNTNLYRRVL